MDKGRPTLYKPEYNQMLIKHMEKGLSYESFAGLVSVCKDTLYEWEKVHEDFSYSKKEGFEKNRLFWEQTGLANIKDKDFNATIWIFNMKNRFPAEWREKQENINHNNNINQSLSEYKAQIESERELAIKEKNADKLDK